MDKGDVKREVRLVLSAWGDSVWTSSLFGALGGSGVVGVVASRWESSRETERGRFLYVS